MGLLRSLVVLDLVCRLCLCHFWLRHTPLSLLHPHLGRLLTCVLVLWHYPSLGFFVASIIFSIHAPRLLSRTSPTYALSVLVLLLFSYSTTFCILMSFHRLCQCGISRLFFRVDRHATRRDAGGQSRYRSLSQMSTLQHCSLAHGLGLRLCSCRSYAVKMYS